MSIREWYGSDKEYNQSSLVAQALDKFLKLYSEAMKAYIGFPEAESLTELYKAAKIYRRDSLNPLFIKWMKEKAIPYFRDELLEMDFEENMTMVYQIEYIEYILSEEMEYFNSQGSDKDTIRSCLVDMASWMPERIEDSYSLNEDVKFVEELKVAYIDNSENDEMFAEDFVDVSHEALETEFK